MVNIIFLIKQTSSTYILHIKESKISVFYRYEFIKPIHDIKIVTIYLNFKIINI